MFLPSVNAEATLNSAGIFLSIVLADQGTNITLPFCFICVEQEIRFFDVFIFGFLKSSFSSFSFIRLITSFSVTPDTSAPGKLVNGLPEFSHASRCAAAARLLSVLSFQSNGLEKNASFAAKCKDGVLLPAAGVAPMRCACKFLVPHFSSFGVSFAAWSRYRHPILFN
jgi:hypothetical protein